MSIEILCLEKNEKQNPYLIQTIFLSEEKDGYYAIFKCENEEKCAKFFSHVRLALMSQRANEHQLDFFLIEEPSKKDTLTVRGNISKAIDLLIDEGILKGRNKILFTDKEEEEIQDFLNKTASMSPYKGEKIKKVVTSKEENEDNKIEKVKGCTIL